jgi:hypothetical protein
MFSPLRCHSSNSHVREEELALSIYGILIRGSKNREKKVMNVFHQQQKTPNYVNIISDDENG